MLILNLLQVIHPIHDQTLYLDEKHKKKLKEEFGKKLRIFSESLMLNRIVKLSHSDLIALLTVNITLFQMLSLGHLSNTLVKLFSFLLDAHIK